MKDCPETTGFHYIINVAENNQCLVQLVYS